MRYLGAIVTIAGALAVAIGLFSGMGALFSWNGRHPIDVRPLPVGRTQQSLVPVPGRRYTLSVQAVFDRRSAPERDGVAVVEAQMPLIVRVKDRSGTSLADVAGWLDPNEPPSILYGQAMSAQNAARAELMVERLVGPFTSARSDPLDVTVDLEADRVGAVPILERRLVVYDDELPGSIRLAFAAAAAGAIALLAGIVLLVMSFLRRMGKRRGGIRSRRIV